MIVVTRRVSTVLQMISIFITNTMNSAITGFASRKEQFHLKKLICDKNGMNNFIEMN